MGPASPGLGASLGALSCQHAAIGLSAACQRDADTEQRGATRAGGASALSGRLLLSRTLRDRTMADGKRARGPGFLPQRF
jgi:hypothetical protein